MKQDGLHKFHQTLHSLTKTKLWISISQTIVHSMALGIMLIYHTQLMNWRIVIVGFIGEFVRTKITD